MSIPCRGSRIAGILGFLLVFASPSRIALAAEIIAVPVPEPILTESLTDIDGAEDNELEVELNGGVMRARRGGARIVHTSLELEYRLNRKFGFLLEPGWGYRSGDGQHFDVSTGAALNVLRDVARDWYAQIELTGRIPPNTDLFTAGEQALPISAMLRGAARTGRLTLRPGFGLEGGGDASTHVALRAAMALLVPVTADPRFGVIGFEVDADWARATPYTFSPNVVADATPLGIPLRLGVALPWTIGTDATTASLGLYVRLYYVSDREQAFGKK